MESNRRTYESDDIVELCRSRLGLLKPEEAILQLIEPAIRNGRVLDIGVGGGRTTSAFSAKAREYVGIDYSEKMIAACREKFRNAPASVSFLVCDVRDMHRFTNHDFNVVIFSFNGLDLISHDDRLIALREISRVCVPGGWFVFSTHNLRSAHAFFQYLPLYANYFLHPLSLLHVIRDNQRRRGANPGFRKSLRGTHAILNDGTYDFRLHQYFIDPHYQMEQLDTLDFSNVHVFSPSGAEVKASEVDMNRDQWLYFMCQTRTNE